MRLRRVKNAEEGVENSIFCIHDPASVKGQWTSAFPKKAPLMLEIGMGKGQFLMQMAALHPDINFLGIEVQRSVLYRAIQKMEENPLPNLRFLCVNAEALEDYFDAQEIDRIYLNFSDPWPKERHAKRRLTSPRFLERYDHVLAKDGYIAFKTDNTELFQYSLEAAEGSPFQVTESTTDLHHDAVLSEGNVMTEYEERFSRRGNKICYMKLERR